MDNYFVQDEIDDYSDNYNKFSNNKTKYIFIGIVILVIIIGIIIISSNSSFSSYENKLISLARNYVSSHGITTNKEIYIDVSKLDINLPDNCSMLSGVIYNGQDYHPYLLCSNYESKIVNNPSNLKLKGNDVIVLLNGMNYYELGYEGNGNISISGSDINGEGVYNIYYIPEVGNYLVIRKVIVINNPSLEKYYPIINTTNEDEVILKKGTQYYDVPVAYDSVDGDLTNKIIEVNDVNESVAGEYKVIYSVRNSMGYTRIVKKKVHVVDDSEDIDILASLSNENITSEAIYATIKIVGGNYKYIKLPDGSETTKKEFDYLIEENGKYDFIVVLENGKEISKTLNVTNIDKTIPTGTCKALVYYDHASVSVDISSFNYIVGYNYYVNEKESGFISSKTYNATQKDVNSVYVIVKDYIGNEGKISCNTEKKSNFDPNGIHNVIRDKPRLRVQITSALAKKGYTVNDLNMCIYNRVKEAGPYTRYGVAAAAYGLIECTYQMTGYVLSYNHTSGKVEEEKTKSGGKTNYCGVGAINYDICGKLGVNSNWGKPGGTCTKDECWHGLNCATFVRWAMCNGGMNLCSRGSASAHEMTNVKYFPEADGVSIKGRSVSYYSGKNLIIYDANTILHMIKPGDAIASNEGGGHTFMVVGIDNDGIYTAEDGYYMRYIKFSQMTNGEQTYRILLLDNYYANPNNYNNLYN